MTRSPKYALLYDAFEQFLQRCVLADRSLLWPNEEAWTAENVAEVKRRLIETPIFGSERSFEDKLQEQMRGALAQHWMILCDIYYVYFLPSSYIKPETKQDNVYWAAQQGGLTPPAKDAEIWKAQGAGFTRTAQKYHQKYAQFWLLLLFAGHLKNLANPGPVVRDPQQVQQVLDGLVEGIPNKIDRAYDMRHAILYMTFPDRYERIISTRDKEKIVQIYGNRIEGPVPTDLDEAIRRIRQALSTEHDKADHPFDFYDDLKSQRVGSIPSGDGKPPIVPSLVEEDVTVVLSILAQTRNVILYGPPGTGKTYVAKKAAGALVKQQIKQPLSEPALFQRVIEGLATYEVLALGMYLSSPQGTYSVSEILNLPIVQAQYRLSPVKQPRHNVWGHLQWHTSSESKTVNVEKSTRREPYLFDKDSQGHWLLTDMGRTYVEETLSEQLSTLRSSAEVRDIGEFIMWATFHQSYAYEDFVEGLRPVQSDESPGDISYDIVPGVFKRICMRAAQDPGNKYILVIDEINRGNIAKILGELITLLEDDKRIGEPNALSVALPYSGESFSVPGNLYIVGTMNTADRSIALLDVALRRRFAFVELMPRPELLDEVKVESQEASVPLGDLLRGLNLGIRSYLDRDHQIGHSYFLKVAQAGEAKRVDVLEFVWNNQIIPLLEEYFYSQRDKLAELLAPFRTDVEPGIEAEQEEDFELGRQTGDDLLVALAKIAEGGKQ